MKTIINTLFGLLFALAIIGTIGYYLPVQVYAQAGTGPHGQKYYDYNNSIIAIPTTLDPVVGSPVCTKNGIFGIYNGTLYVCMDLVWRRVTLSSVTPTPTFTPTPSSTSTPTPTP